MKKTMLGGDRLGAGGKQKIYMPEYDRSTQDLGKTFRTTMSSGTLVPFYCQVGLPGDMHPIELNCDVLTHPTIGPLFGSYKVQLDVFRVPIRLYNSELHMDKLGIGNDMSQVKLPIVQIKGRNYELGKDLDNQHINPSCLFSYLGIRGLGYEKIATGQDGEIIRHFNAGFYLSYFDIFKNYYANKQEENAWIIHNDLTAPTSDLTASTWDTDDQTDVSLPVAPTNGTGTFGLSEMDSFSIEIAHTTANIGDVERYELEYQMSGAYTVTIKAPITEIFDTVFVDTANDKILCSGFTANDNPGFANHFNPGIFDTFTVRNISYNTDLYAFNDTAPRLVEFPLANIDAMKTALLQDATHGTAYQITLHSDAPYGLPLHETGAGTKYYSVTSNQEGLLLKTYQSDLFNNWVETDWIDGATGVNEISKVSTAGDEFTIDALNIASKIHKMLMRIGISGGSYNDWQEAVWTHKGIKKANSPVYIGGLIKELSFQEVVSNSATDTEPLGTLAGRGRLTGKHKGGKMKLYCDELSWIMGIVSITPRLDYSQGNHWTCNLATLDDFHKPALDAIGFQDLITEQMAHWTTENGGNTTQPRTYKSAGKQPAWINYKTEVNTVHGNFADANQQMFMTLNRRYESEHTTSIYTYGSWDIKDLTTYIDPSKFNHIFADARLDAQNFWVQINIKNDVRRKISNSVIPNL